MKVTRFGNFLAIATLLTTASTTVNVVAAEGAEYSSNGVVQFVPNTDPTQPVDPTNPTNPVHPIDPTNPTGPQPGTAGPLSIDYASSLDFGSNKISSKDETYYAKPQTYSDKDKVTANYVQVTDNRGSSAGWSLKVKQNKQFENTKATYRVLKGAEISINDNKAVSNSVGVTAPNVSRKIVLEPGTAVSVMEAVPGAGDSTWISLFGEVGTVSEQQDRGLKTPVLKNTSVTLKVPGSTPKSAVEYRSSLTWILAEVVSNQ